MYIRFTSSSYKENRVSSALSTKLAAIVSFAALAAACSGGNVPSTTAAVLPRGSSTHLGRPYATESTPPIPIPSNGAYFGGRVNPDSTPPAPAPSPSAYEHEVEVLESNINRSLATDMHYLGWTGITTTRLGDADFQGDISHGRIPVISWSCPGVDESITLTQLTSELKNKSGTDYTTAVNAATAIKNLGTPIFLRFFWEFNDNLNNQETNNDGPCFTQYVGSQKQTVAQKGAEFVAAWKALVDLFRQNGARNVAWLWNPAYDPSDHGDATLTELLNDFLPDANFVDWIGVDAYDKNDAGFDATLTPFYQQFGTAGYPIMIGETGEEEGVGGYCTQANYFVDATYSISGSGTLTNCPGSTDLTSFPNVRAFMYFDAETNLSYDWILKYPSNPFTAFSNMANDSYFAPTLANP